MIISCSWRDNKKGEQQRKGEKERRENRRGRFLDIRFKILDFSLDQFNQFYQFSAFYSTD
jgi:hypothetical protein